MGLMQIADRVLPFLPHRRLRPAKATLSKDTRAGVDHLIAMAPILGRTNPAGVPVVEHVMQNLIDAPTPDDGGQKHTPASTLTVHRGAADEHTPEARTHRCLMAMLVDMHRDLLAAS